MPTSSSQESRAQDASTSSLAQNGASLADSGAITSNTKTLTRTYASDQLSDFIELIPSDSPDDIVDYIFKHFDKEELDTLVPEIVDLYRKARDSPQTKAPAAAGNTASTD